MSKSSERLWWLLAIVVPSIFVIALLLLYRTLGGALWVYAACNIGLLFWAIEAIRCRNFKAREKVLCFLSSIKGALALAIAVGCLAGAAGLMMGIPVDYGKSMSLAFAQFAAPYGWFLGALMGGKNVKEIFVGDLLKLQSYLPAGMRRKITIGTSIHQENRQTIVLDDRAPSKGVLKSILWALELAFLPVFLLMALYPTVVAVYGSWFATHTASDRAVKVLTYLDLIDDEPIHENYYSREILLSSTPDKPGNLLTAKATNLDIWVNSSPKLKEKDACVIRGDVYLSTRSYSPSSFPMNRHNVMFADEMEEKKYEKSSTRRLEQWTAGALGADEIKARQLIIKGRLLGIEVPNLPSNTKFHYVMWSVVTYPRALNFGQAQSQNPDCKPAVNLIADVNGRREIHTFLDTDIELFVNSQPAQIAKDALIVRGSVMLATGDFSGTASGGVEILDNANTTRIVSQKRGSSARRQVIVSGDFAGYDGPSLRGQSEYHFSLRPKAPLSEKINISTSFVDEVAKVRVRAKFPRIRARAFRLFRR